MPIRFFYIYRETWTNHNKQRIVVFVCLGHVNKNAVLTSSSREKTWFCESKVLTVKSIIVVGVSRRRLNVETSRFPRKYVHGYSSELGYADITRQMHEWNTRFSIPLRKLENGSRSRAPIHTGRSWKEKKRSWMCKNCKSHRYWSATQFTTLFGRLVHFFLIALITSYVCMHDVVQWREKEDTITRYFTQNALYQRCSECWQYTR